MNKTGRVITVSRLFVVDIDGTVAHDDYISDETAVAFQNLKRDGWRVMVATGRVLASAMPHIKRIGADSPVIVYDGARVMDPFSETSIFETLIAADTVTRLLEAIWDFPMRVQVYGDEQVRCRPDDEQTAEFFRSIDVAVDPDLTEPVATIPAYRIILHGQPDKAEEMHHAARDRAAGIAEVTLAGPGFIDILPCGISKGSALMRYIETLPESERPLIVAAAGDHMNDMEMLRAADIALAPSDGAPSLLKLADAVFPPAAEGGFSKVPECIEKLVDTGNLKSLIKGGEHNAE